MLLMLIAAADASLMIATRRHYADAACTLLFAILAIIRFHFRHARCFIDSFDYFAVDVAAYVTPPLFLIAIIFALRFCRAAGIDTDADADFSLSLLRHYFP